MQKSSYFYYQISIPLSSKKSFIYFAKSEIQSGTIVQVSFRNKKTIGMIINFVSQKKLPQTTFKEIEKEIVTLKNIKAYAYFVRKFAFYNICNESEITKQFLTIFKKIIDKELKKKNLKKEQKKEFSVKIHEKDKIKLNNEQSFAYQNICKKKIFSTILLYGSTGSGKTEVYTKVIDFFLDSNEVAQALVLLPEIGLVHQTSSIIKSRSQYSVIEWHSLMQSQKEKNLNKILKEKKLIIVGTRSAITIPYQNLKIIIVDEEHDEAYKQENLFCYNARDMSILLAKTLDIPIVLSSATPSVETMVNVQKQKYSMIKINAKYNSSSNTNINIIKTKNSKFMLTQQAINAIDQSISQNKKSLVFLNRKGKFNLIICSKCRTKVLCKNCDSLIVFSSAKYSCRHCQKELREIKCIECNSNKQLSFFIEGIEQLQEEIHARLPNAKILTITRDTVLKKKSNIKQIIEDSSYNILLGTQIISKGYNFKDLDSVIVVDADSGMLKVDVKANERIFQLMHQIFGRVGRYSDGSVHLQTNLHETQLMQTIIKMDQEKFYTTEISNRKNFDFPPFFTYLSITITHRKKNNAKEESELITKGIQNYKSDFEIFGPNACYINKIKNQYRYNILLKSKNKTAIQKILTDFKSKYKKSFNSKIKYDIDPIRFY